MRLIAAEVDGYDTSGIGITFEYTQVQPPGPGPGPGPMLGPACPDREVPTVKEDTIITLADADGNVIRELDIGCLTKPEAEEAIGEFTGGTAEFTQISSGTPPGHIFETLAITGMTESNIATVNGQEVTPSGEQVTKHLDDVDVSTSSSAQLAIEIIDQTLAQVDKERANLGAVQNRLDSAVSNLSNAQENMTVSQGRILDVDFAKETTAMTKSQMLMQAGSSVLTQAKDLPEYAVQLVG